MWYDFIIRYIDAFNGYEWKICQCKAQTLNGKQRLNNFNVFRKVNSWNGNCMW